MNFTIETVEEGANERGEYWVVVMSDDAGSKVNHAFPKDALLWRAAEYGIDPTDTGTLLDIILHEPYIPDPRLNDPPAAAAVRAEVGGKRVPATLATAATTADARTAHLARIAHVKANVRRIAGPQGKGAANPLDVILIHPVDHGRLAEIREARQPATPLNHPGSRR
ncbi:hypothetical protein [Streptomyces sp. CB03911]|uniref:hypothetical protein n=1 Tax=Streptomyces sp. CB03911 TaxID=1804758 RepID=UPI00093A21FD|nr:hypothetical protein [Streptomyces sp. CB03911]OKI16634.1 hypothetical protein A6A07_11545 [Streptomyces sp. CB03911]